MPLHFDIKAYVKDALVVMQGERITINPKFDKHTAAWAKASSSCHSLSPRIAIKEGTVYCQKN
jgi:hypothetical protein